MNENDIQRLMLLAFRAGWARGTIDVVAKRSSSELARNAEFEKWYKRYAFALIEVYKSTGKIKDALRPLTTRKQQAKVLRDFLISAEYADDTETEAAIHRLLKVFA